jgi:H+/Cl- antiporter ClcA
MVIVMKAFNLPRPKAILVCLLIGIGAGLTGSVFLHSLQWVTHWRQAQPLLIWGLPLVGLAIPWLYKQFGFGSEKGLKLVLEEIHTPQQVAPWTMAPLIYLTTLLTHLVGGSAGREGTALQMAASVADRIASWLRVSGRERRWVLMAGLSGGFSAALGAPMAATLFGLEVIVVGRIDFSVILECFIASFTAWGVSVALATPHFQSLRIPTPDFDAGLLLHLLLLALIIGLLSRVHVAGVRGLERLFAGLPARFRVAIGGTLLLGLFLTFPLTLYQGLGLETIRAAFATGSPWEQPLLKLLLTALTLAVGFKGGEFVPLVFIGTTAGSALAHYWQEPVGFFAALGFVSLFGAAAKTPWTCALLAVEYFGWKIAPYALLVTAVSAVIAGPSGIYAGQRLPSSKK